MNVAQNDDKLRRLLEVGRALVSELDLETVLQRILDEAREITGARYVALGVLDEQRRELERFLTSGIDAETGRAIGEKPRGRGVLGVLIKDPRPLRLTDVARHPQSFGFPAGHPEMKTFLGVPILIRGQAWGNLYLTEKHAGAEFTEADEEAAVVLAQWAATAIDNARLYETSELRRVQAERAVLGLRAARDITDAIAGAGELDPVLELIVERGRALVDARTVLIMLREGDELGGRGQRRARRSRRGAPVADLGLDLEGSSSNADALSASTTSPHICGSPRTGWACPTRTPRCSCRCSTKAPRWVCWRPSTGAATARRSAPSTRSSCGRSRPRRRTP